MPPRKKAASKAKGKGGPRKGAKGGGSGAAKGRGGSKAKGKGGGVAGGSASSAKSQKKYEVRGFHHCTAKEYESRSCGQTYPPSKRINELSFVSRPLREKYDPSENADEPAATEVSDASLIAEASIDGDTQKPSVDDSKAEGKDDAVGSDGSKKTSIVTIRRTKAGLLSVEQITDLERTHFPITVDQKPLDEADGLKSALDSHYYPINQTLPHPSKDGIDRMADDNKISMERELEFQNKIESLREGAEIHRQIRQAAQQFIQPGRTMVEICEFIENNTLRLTGYDPSEPYARGYGFPTGCSLNDCAAHYTPNSGDKTKLKSTDICKIDFGVQINGYIIDCAYSFSFDPMHDELMQAVKAATNTGIRVMGIDARLGEVGAAIQEVMESYQCEYKGKVYDVKAIENLNGHSIAPWVIHGGKSVPIVAREDNTKMEEGELFAIETFGSVMGKGRVEGYGDCSHFALMPEAMDIASEGRKIEHKGTYELYKHIQKRFGTIPFCRRWLDAEGQNRHLLTLKRLVDYGLVRDYPPLMELPGAYTAQYEHTILLRPTCKEVLSRGQDF